MRDDQIIKLIQKECAYVDNVSVLRSQQARIRLDSMISAICEPMCLWRTLFKPEYFYKKVEEIYGIKSKAFNEDLLAKLNRERIKI